MRIYIAGKISGENMADCTLKFDTAYNAIRKMGAEAVNPITVVNDWNTTWVDAMRKCMAALMTCDAIYALPDYTDSTGAMIETDLALKMHMPVYHHLRQVEKALNR